MQTPLGKECTKFTTFPFFFFLANNKDLVCQLYFLNISWTLHLNSCQNLLSFQHSYTTRKRPQFILNQKCSTIDALTSFTAKCWEKLQLLLWKIRHGHVNFTAGWHSSAHVSNTVESRFVLVLVYGSHGHLGLCLTKKQSAHRDLQQF